MDLTHKENISTENWVKDLFHSVNDENLSVVAEECLTVLGKSICINEQAELNIANKN